MEQSFNLKRALLIFRSLCIVYNKWFKWILFIIIIIISISAIEDMITNTCSRGGLMGGDGARKSFTVIWYFGPMIAYILVFMQYRNKLYVNTLQILPASINEKFFVPFLTSLIFVPIVLCLLYFILLFLSWVISLFVNSNPVGYIDAMLNVFTYYSKYHELVVYIPFLFHACGCFSIILFRHIWIFVSIMITMFGTLTFPYVFMTPKEFMPYSNYYFIIMMLLYWIIAYLRFRKIQLNKRGGEYYGESF